jgi:hypothetical protein
MNAPQYVSPCSFIKHVSCTEYLWGIKDIKVRTPGTAEVPQTYGVLTQNGCTNHWMGHRLCGERESMQLVRVDALKAEAWYVLYREISRLVLTDTHHIAMVN